MCRSRSKGSEGSRKAAKIFEVRVGQPDYQVEGGVDPDRKGQKAHAKPQSREDL